MRRALSKIWDKITVVVPMAFFVAFLMALILIARAAWVSHASPRQGVVIRDYYRAAGISRRIEGDDMSLTKKLYGEPLSVDEEPFYEKTLLYLHYDGFAILFLDDGERAAYYGFELYSPQRKLRKDIRVGSSREQIIAAYSKCPSIDAWRVNGYEKGDELWDCRDINYFSNILTFTYDENDLVTSIRYVPGGP